MSGLNFKHLRYFWTVLKAGSIARASAQLHVTPQSISSQLAELETALGTALFRRVGRGLEATEIGRRIAGYAEDIFALEDEILGVVRDHDKRAALPFRVGVADSVAKLLAYRVLDPALHLPEPIRLSCREGPLVSLLGDLSVHRLDMVIADRPMPADLKVKAFSHRLGGSEVSLFAAPALAARLKGPFPRCLDGAPLLLPGPTVAIRPQLEEWLAGNGLRPRIVGEFDDSALVRAFGEGAAGVFAAPTAIAGYLQEHDDMRLVGRVPEVVEQLFAISTERRLRHPALIAVSEAAAREVFTELKPPARRARRSPVGKVR